MSIFGRIGQLSLATAFAGLALSSASVSAAPLSIGRLDLPIPVPVTRNSAPMELMPWSLKPDKFMNATASTLAPFAFVKLCVNDPAICETGGSKMVTLNRRNKILLSYINRSVNRTIKPRNDVGDIWTVGAYEGDCEDYALTKRQKLIKQGFSPSALRMAVATTPTGEGHAVLVITTDSGDMVLDNRTNKITPWKDSDLAWIKIQSHDKPLLWKTIEV